MAHSLQVRFLSSNGTLLAEKSIPLRNERPIGYDALTDLLFGVGLDTYATRLDSGEFKVNGESPRDKQFSGRVEFKSTQEEGVGTGPSTAVAVMAQGIGSGNIHIPAGSTVAAAFARANIAIPAGSTLMMNGQNVRATALIPAGANVILAAVGQVKGGC